MSQTLGQMVAAARSEAQLISPTKAAEARQEAALKFIVDVREPGEYKKGHLPGAINIPRGMLEMRADAGSPVADSSLCSDPGARILVYCTKDPGARSLLSAQTLGTMGYRSVEVLGGGLVAWTEAGLPVEGGDEQPALCC